MRRTTHDELKLQPAAHARPGLFHPLPFHVPHPSRPSTLLHAVLALQLPTRAFTPAAPRQGRVLHPSIDQLTSCHVAPRPHPRCTSAHTRHRALRTGTPRTTTRAVQPLACAARCLCEFHAAGLVHRDVRAGHILWFPDPAGGGGDGGSRCTLIDLSCALPAGTAVSLAGVKLAYAAPEIVEASFRGAGSIEVTQAHDEWALGVLIFEALTGHPAFDLWGGSEAKVCLPSA